MTDFIHLPAARLHPGTVALPGSKSISNRTLLLAALADNDCEIVSLLHSDDILHMRNALEKLGARVRVMSALKINDVCEDYIRRRAVRHLEKGRIGIFAAGTGNPFFTTDSAAALRAIEINADQLLKATKVDGVYDRDPKKHSDAVRFEELDHDEVIARDLQVMDTAAFALCRDHGIPLRVYDISVPGNLMRILRGERVGTLVRSRR